MIENIAISVEEAKRLIIENTKILEPAEIPLTEAKGYVLAEDIISPVNLPFFTNSAMDGYAVKSMDTKRAGESNHVALKVTGIVRAGDFPDFILSDGEAAKIMTGAPVPKGADSVVMVEYTEEEDGIVKVKRPVNPGENLRYEGEEIKQGEIALESGTHLTSASIGFVAELGINKIKAYRKPKIALVVTGEELVGTDEELGPGKIRDTNSVTLQSALSQEVVESKFIGRVRDEVFDIEEKLKKAILWCDVLLVTGGVSVGDYDYVKEIFKKLGIEGIFWRVSQRPGGPLFFGKRGNSVTFGLPGNPASSLVCFYEYVRPALRRMIGRRDLFLLELEALLSEEIKKSPGKTNFLRGYVEKKGGSFYVKSTGTQGSHILKSFALSNCLIVVPKDATHLPPGSTVKVHLLPE
ncbi:MAG: molybdopterin molybdotransferase MoeA [Deltaproteobacteria bacterium]|nr:molybdopterin molybdotransferase MoeA [Deltaproteobacteria bacterium]